MEERCVTRQKGEVGDYLQERQRQLSCMARQYVNQNFEFRLFFIIFLPCGPNSSPANNLTPPNSSYYWSQNSQTLWNEFLRTPKCLVIKQVRQNYMNNQSQPHFQWHSIECNNIGSKAAGLANPLDRVQNSKVPCD